MTIVDRKWLTPAAAAETLGVCTRTVYRMLQTGEIGGTKVRSGWRIPAAEIDELRYSAEIEARQRRLEHAEFNPSRHVEWTDRVDRLVALALERAIDAGTVSKKKRPGVDVEYIGIQRRSLIRCRERGWISVTAAERVADALGYHPAELWPDWGACGN